PVRDLLLVQQLPRAQEEDAALHGAYLVPLAVGERLQVLAKAVGFRDDALQLGLEESAVGLPEALQLGQVLQHLGGRVPGVDPLVEALQRKLARAAPRDRSRAGFQRRRGATSGRAEEYLLACPPSSGYSPGVNVRHDPRKPPSVQNSHTPRRTMSEETLSLKPRWSKSCTSPRPTLDQSGPGGVHPPPPWPHPGRPAATMRADERRLSWEPR